MNILHTLARTVLLNGVLEYPTEVEPDELHGRQGVNLEADNGGLTPVITGTKRRWVLRWRSPRPEVVDRMWVLTTLTTTIPLTDPTGASYQVVIPIGGLTWKLVHEPSASTAGGTTYPDLEIKLWEA